MSRPGTRAPWRPAKLSRRLTMRQRYVRCEKRVDRSGVDEFGRVGTIHHQAPRKITVPFRRPELPALALGHVAPKQKPAERPANRPSWAIMAGLVRQGDGYRKRGAA